MMEKKAKESFVNLLGDPDSKSKIIMCHNRFGEEIVVEPTNNKKVPLAL